MTKPLHLLSDEMVKRFIQQDYEESSQDICQQIPGRLV